MILNRPAKGKIEKYGLHWPEAVHPLRIEMFMVEKGGSFISDKGNRRGNGMAFHLKAGMQIVWPEIVWHKWLDMFVEAYAAHRTIAVLGPASAGKSLMASMTVLFEWMVFPTAMTVIITSTTMERLQDRIWGEIKMLHSRAIKRYSWLPGHLIDSRLRIIADKTYDPEEARDFRSGIVGVPTLKGLTYVGMSSFVGIKNKKVRHVGDELSMLPKAFVDAISNLDKNPDFKAIGMGNPKETTDALGVLAEPAADIGGWDGGLDQIPQSKVWKTRRPDGCCLQLVGSESPNLDGKLGIPLLTQEQIDRDIAFYGKDSLQYTMMNQGMMPRGQGSRRVLTRQECQKCGATLEPRWLNSTRTKLWTLDAAYQATGGDRCVLGFFEFGEEMPDDTDLPTRLTSAFVNQPVPDSQKRMILAQLELLIVPISPAIDASAPDQIVDFVRAQCMQRNVPAENGFYDAGMRTALVQSFSRLWSNKVNSVDFGGKPTEQMVSHDEQVKCCDRYSKFVTELWYSVRHVVIARQYRGMTEDVIMEFAQREWTMVGANKIEVEPKSKMKEKTGRSPDLADTVALGIWGARQRGFVIKRLKSPKQEEERQSNWKRELRETAAKFWASGQLTEA